LQDDHDQLKQDFHGLVVTVGNSGTTTALGNGAGNTVNLILIDSAETDQAGADPAKTDAD
jgi:hypothetical protein